MTVEYQGTIVNANFHEIKKHKALIASLEKSIRDLKLDLQRAQDRNTELESTIVELRAKINRDRNRIADLNCKVKGL